METLLEKGLTRGMLTVVGPVRSNQTRYGHRKWRAKCECSRIRVFWGYELTLSNMMGDRPQVGRGVHIHPVYSCGEPECRKTFLSRDTLKRIGGLDRQEAYAAETKRIRGVLAGMTPVERMR